MAISHTLLPNALVWNVGFAATGGTMVGSVSDSSDSTYIRKGNTSSTGGVRYSLGNPSLASDEIVWRCTATARFYQGAGGSLGISVGSSLNATTLPVNWIVGTFGSGTTFTNASSFAVEPRSFTTSATTQQDLANALELQISDYSPSGGSPINRATIAELSLTLETTVLPTTTVTGIDGDTSSPFTVTTTTRPTLQWTYAQSDSIDQYAYEVRVFTASKTDPTVDTNLVWASGIQVATGFGSAQIAADLVNGTTYYAYVRNAMRIGGTDYWSAWGSGTAGSQLQFSVSLTAPTTPTVTTSWDSTNQRATVNVQGSAFGSGTQTFLVERQDESGGPWVTVRGGSALTPNGSHFASVVDYETPRGARGTNKTVNYRAFAVGVVSGARVSSAASTVSALTVVTDGLNWLKNPLDSSVNKGGWNIQHNVDFEVEESVEVYRPLGRADAVVVSGALGGDDGTLDIIVTSDSDWEDARDLLVSQSVLLWQDPFGKQLYIRPIRRSWTKRGGVSAPRWEFRVEYVAVAAP